MRCARRTRGEDRADRGEGVVRLPIRGCHDAENGRSGRLLAALVRGFHNPKGSAQALASTVNIFGQPCLYCDRACPSISRSRSDRVTEPCSTPSPAPHGRHDVRGTGSSNPSPSSRESVSLFRIHLRRSTTPAFRAGVRGWLGDRVGRDAQGVSISRQPAAISLPGHIPVPQCR